MIKCFVVMCLVSDPTICQPPIEIEPDDGNVVTSPMQCGRGGFTYFSQQRMEQQTPEGSTPKPLYFPKVYGKMIGDGSGIVQSWIDKERARLKATEPQIK